MAPASDILDRDTAVTAALVTNTNRALFRIWSATVTDLSDETAERWLALAIPLVEGAKQQAATSAAVAADAVLTEQLGRPPTRPATELNIADVTGGIRKGAAPRDVYSRPMATARTVAGAGHPFVEALRRGARRAATLAATDVQLARTHATREILSAEPRVVGYRRVLTGAESCGLCAVATTQRYRTSELMPIHPGCDCGIAPIVGTDDPGRVINQPLLDRVHGDIAERFGPDAVDRGAGRDVFDDRDHPYRQLSTAFEHGEYGPTLARAGDSQLTSSAASARPGVADAPAET